MKRRALVAATATATVVAHHQQQQIRVARSISTMRSAGKFYQVGDLAALDALDLLRAAQQVAHQVLCCQSAVQRLVRHSSEGVLTASAWQPAACRLFLNER